MKLNNVIILGLVAILALGGCAKYKVRPLKRLVMHVPIDERKNHIALAYHVFSQDDCKVYLDRNVIAQDYQPIHITLTNNTGRYLNFDLQGFNFPCAASISVAQTVHTNTVGRAVGYSVAGLFLPLFFIPAIVDGLGSAQANEQLDVDFYNKTLQSQIIKPFSAINGLVFVHTKDFDNTFELTLIDVETHERFTLGTQKLALKI